MRKPELFRKQDFKRSVYCWAHWKRDASNAWRVILCFFEFYIIWNPAHGVDRHVHIILLEFNFLLLLLELNFQQKYFPFISLSVLCKELYKTKKKMLISLSAVSSNSSYLIQATDDIECVQVENYARNVFVWTFFRICRRNPKKHCHQTLNK